MKELYLCSFASNDLKRSVERYLLQAKAMNAYQNIEDKKLNQQFSTVYYSQFSTKPLSSNKLSSILPQKEGCWDTATIMSSFRIDKSGRLIIGTMGAAKGFGEKIHLSWAKKKLQSLSWLRNLKNKKYPWWRLDTFFSKKKAPQKKQREQITCRMSLLLLKRRGQKGRPRALQIRGSFWRFIRSSRGDRRERSFRGARDDGGCAGRRGDGEGEG